MNPLPTPFDLIVIGSGPGGQRAAIQAAKLGKRVAIIEAHPALGGACVHVGTLPSKSFRESVYRWSLSSQGSLGAAVPGGREPERSVRARKGALPDMARLLQRRDRVVSGECQVIFDQLKRNQITVFNGRARIKGPGVVEFTSKKGVTELKTKIIVVATGANPMAPAHIQVDGRGIHDSNTILNLKALPKSMVVLGADVIGCEYASIFSMAGTKVHLIDKRHEILASVDREIVDHLVERFESQGMQMRLSCEATRLEYVGKGKERKVRVHLSDGKKIMTDVVLAALGRQGDTSGLGLENAGIVVNERGLIPVDKHYRTTCPDIYAVGDVIGAPALASTSMEQGRIASLNAFHAGEAEMSAFFPYGIYTIPEISMVGKTSEELTAQKVDFVIGRARYRELARGQIVGDRWGILKLLVDRKTLKILGVHVVGDAAANLVHIGQAVMALGGDVNYFIGTVFNYPTLAEAYKTAAFHAINQMKLDPPDSPSA